MSLNRQIEQNVAEIAKVEERDRRRMSWVDHLADLMTAFSGSMLFVMLHGAWFAVWITINQGWFGIGTFDAFPYGLLTMIVSLEAIFLSTFVLISENRQAAQADRRAKVDLQMNIIAEQEVTKLVEMVTAIQQHLGMTADPDPLAQQMKEPTYVGAVADAVDAAESDTSRPAAVRPRAASGHS